MAWPACGSATCFFAAVAGLAAGFLVAGFLTAGFLTGGGVAAGGICILEWSISWAETGADPSARPIANAIVAKRSEEHTSELQSLMRNSYAVFCLKKKIRHNKKHNTHRV